MKKQLYKQTDAGIRIPKRKIKWMASPVEKASEEPAPRLFDSKDNIDLYYRNLDFLLHTNESPETGEEVEEYETGWM